MYIYNYICDVFCIYSWLIHNRADQSDINDLTTNSNLLNLATAPAASDITSGYEIPSANSTPYINTTDSSLYKVYRFINSKLVLLIFYHLI